MPRRSNPEVLHLPTTALKQAVKKFPTPFFLYDEKKIRSNCTRFRDTFKKYFPEFAPLYALKANTNPDIIKIIFSEGFGADASSMAEAWVTEQLGGWGMYTGNYTTEDEFRYASGCGLLLNLDDPSMLATIKMLNLPALLCLRINPGISKGSMQSL
ncbi:MAG: diaminopimelate decarboxylase, partial [Planctomycetes bacterium]|nr:diaminopimelate decarboxylase [Planctomycetota bacterium]